MLSPNAGAIPQVRNLAKMELLNFSDAMSHIAKKPLTKEGKILRHRIAFITLFSLASLSTLGYAVRSDFVTALNTDGPAAAAQVGGLMFSLCFALAIEQLLVSYYGTRIKEEEEKGKRLRERQAIAKQLEQHLAVIATAPPLDQKLAMARKANKERDAFLDSLKYANRLDS